MWGKDVLEEIYGIFSAFGVDWKIDKWQTRARKQNAERYDENNKKVI